jgi:transposase InsO family protein
MQAQTVRLREEAVHHTERLADAGIAPSVGSRRDSYDIALAESVIGLYKTKVIRRRGRSPAHVARRSTSNRLSHSPIGLELANVRARTVPEAPASWLPYFRQSY